MSPTDEPQPSPGDAAGGDALAPETPADDTMLLSARGIRKAFGQNEVLRGIYEEVREELWTRVFREDAQGELVPDTPRNRLVVRGWAAMCEELVIAWHTDPGDVGRDELLEIVVGALPALVEVSPPGSN